MSAKRYEVELAGRPLVLETGEWAQQAGGAVTLRYGDTMLLGTVTASTPRRGIDFFPLSVEFEERLYAAGRIPGSFFRREGRPTTTAVLSARLTDRPLRPLFPKGYMDDTQIVITVLSADMENPPDTLGTIAASAALMISDVPFDGPVGSVRIGRVDGEFIVQPTFAQLAESDLNLVVAGTGDAIMMVEAEAGEASESALVEALALGQDAIAGIAQLQEQMRADVGKEKRAYTPKEIDPAAASRVDAECEAELTRVLAPDSGLTKAERDAARDALRAQLVEGVEEEAETDKLKDAFEALEKRIVRHNILADRARPDGRTPTDIRPLKAEVGMIPRTHGSGLFERGETQVLSLTTLAGSSMAQRLDDLTPEDTKRFMHHYNFPPWSVGETGRIGAPGRREIGHGMLGERALSAIIPNFEDFPYTIRLVSEVLSSNGSTSMASVCAAVLSMMDAGVPLKKPIAGIAMGLIKGDDEDFAVLTDIAGLEDHLGDMDFKVAGSRDGVTALQMDIKVKGISLAVMEQALAQARDARLEIMDVMLSCIAEPREELAAHAPRMYKLEIPVEKIGLIIGPGGKTIRQIEEDSGASINIENDGTIYVMATDQKSAQIATDQIKALTKEVEPGEIYTGKVVRILSFGAFVEILPGKDALVHISELAHERVPSVEDVVKVGDEVQVKITEIDNMGRINASRKALLAREEGAGASYAESGRDRDQGRDRDRDRDRGRDDDERRGPRRPPRARSGERERDDEPAGDEGGGERPAQRRRDEDDAAGDDGGDGDGQRRRRRRRRRKKVGGATGSSDEEPIERQPASNDGRSRNRSSVLARVGLRRAPGESSGDGPPAPPPPPRTDFGAPR